MLLFIYFVWSLVSFMNLWLYIFLKFGIFGKPLPPPQFNRHSGFCSSLVQPCPSHSLLYPSARSFLAFLVPPSSPVLLSCCTHRPSFFNPTLGYCLSSQPDASTGLLFLQLPSTPSFHSSPSMKHSSLGCSQPQSNFSLLP